ncbi:MAG TPA: NUDIX domain-containing protein [Candidatus Paceibacterota bacterium]|nr:NUDIX domain-containing protein [Candidatus Paceibacterota bacterium]
MSATLRLVPALAAATKIHAEDPSKPLWQPGWKLRVNGEEMPAETDWEVTSRFGAVRPAVVPHADGTPNFDRPLYSEAPNVNIVAYGVEDDGTVRIAIIRQPRPHANDPLQPGVDGHAPVVFGQIAMGFLEKIIGETAEEAAQRETDEETGGCHVLSMFQPAYPYHNPNPTFVDTWSDLWFVQVNLKRINELKFDRNEPIFSAEYVTVEELFSRIKSGVDADGAVYRMCTANSILMIFFATFPQYLAGVVGKELAAV